MYDLQQYGVPFLYISTDVRARANIEIKKYCTFVVTTVVLYTVVVVLATTTYYYYLVLQAILRR